jgi:hypothetical protein
MRGDLSQLIRPRSVAAVLSSAILPAQHSISLAWLLHQFELLYLMACVLQCLKLYVLVIVVTV